MLIQMLFRFLTFNLALFLVGLFGVILQRRSILVVLRSIELRLLAVNRNLITFAIHLDDLLGLIFSLLVLTVAAAESAVGLAILVVFYRIRGSVSMDTSSIRHG